MADRKSIRVKLDYPLEHVRDPVIYHLVVDYRLVPNIRRANIDAHIGGMLVLQLDGAPDDLEAGMEYLRRQGIIVTEVSGEEAWTV